jgi:Na+/proline symporter
VVLLFISWLTSRNSTDETFFNGDHKSPWYIVAFGLVGTSLSGVSLISVTGAVTKIHWSYLQMVLGFVAGYLVISYVLLPLYYRLKLTSIYNYLEIRFGVRSRMTGSIYFIVSRMFGAAGRMYIAVQVLFQMVFHPLGLSFEAAVAVVLLLIFLYTFQTGIKAIIWTDTLQTILLIVAVGLTVYTLKNMMGLSIGQAWEQMKANNLNEMATTGSWGFVKSFLSGIFICVTMTGLDQGMMQRSLSCPNLKDAQKNLLSFSGVVLIMNIFFLFIGGLLALFMQSKGLDFSAHTDDIYPYIAQNFFTLVPTVIFVLGLIAATFSSADDALAALTTSFCLDILKMDEKGNGKAWLRKGVHLGFAVLMFFVIILFFKDMQNAVIIQIFNIASITYGPLLGLFAFGYYTKRAVADKHIPWISVFAPIVIMALCYYSGYLSIVEKNPLTWKLDLSVNGVIATIFTNVRTEIIVYIGGFTMLLLYIFSEGKIDPEVEFDAIREKA